MKIIALFIILFLTSCMAKEKKLIAPKKNNELNWLLSGLPDDHTNENLIAKLYGFQFVDMGGCVVSKKLRDSIRMENKKLSEMLTNKFGKNWRIDFDKRVAYVNERIKPN